MQLANLTNYRRVTRAAIAKHAGVATGSVSYHFKSMKKLQDAIVERAVEGKVLKVVAQALANRHPVAAKAPEVVRKAAVALLVG